ncbi:putative adipose-regulatory protein-domain-containing protein [Hyaloraphidium curvatum]|nr:putative adipose-regulatory protein-domain-containing protein [Hyaloraphidium curvatum]
MDAPPHSPAPLPDAEPSERGPATSKPRGSLPPSWGAAPPSEPPPPAPGALSQLIALALELGALFLRPLRPLAGPVLAVLSARSVQRGALTLLVFSAVSAFVLATAVGAYAALYWWYVPGRGWTQDVFFDYAGPLEAPRMPRAVLDMTVGGLGKRSVLTPDQRYDLVLDLVVPECEDNFAVGNFMVRAEFRTANGSLTHETARPALLRHKSRPVRFLSSLSLFPPIFFGVWTEEQRLRIPVVDGFLERSEPRTASLVLLLSHPSLRTYSARLLLAARFTGLRWFMYHRRIPTAVFLISLIAFAESAGLFILWRAAVARFGGAGEAVGNGGMGMVEMEPMIEEEEEGSVSAFGSEDEGFGDAGGVFGDAPPAEGSGEGKGEG